MTMEVEAGARNRESVSSTAAESNRDLAWLPPKPSIGFEIPTRYVMAVLAFFGFVLNYMLRINMSIALVAMVRRNSSIFGLSLGNLTQESHTNSAEDGEFDWDDQVQSLITGSFFWGYVLTQIPGGRFAEIFGSKYIFGFSILMSGLATILIPLAAEENPLKLICLRVLLGIFEGATYPSMHAMLARWAPPEERSRFTSIVYSGSQAGTVLTLPLCGLIISAWGWRASFYFMGALPVFWAVLWVYFVFDSPETHPRISAQELAYLRKALKDSVASSNSSAKVPWLRIATSLPFWAILIAGLASNWGFWTLLTLMPTYMKTMLGFDIKKNSLLSSIPYLTMWFFGVSFSLLADHFRSSGFMSTKNVRKLSTFICLGLPACAQFGVTFVGVATIPTLVLFTISVGFCGAKYSAYLSNHIDIAPNYAGTLLGIGNAVSTIPGWLAPLVAATFTNGNQTLEQWHKVFYIATGIYILGFVFFLCFGSGEIQPWNYVAVATPEVRSSSPEKDKRKMSDLSAVSSIVTLSSSHSLHNENYTGRLPDKSVT